MLVGTFSGVISGDGGSAKEGSGTALGLSGKNTHIGATEVNAGTLLVSGNLSDTTAVSVESGGASYELGSDDTVGSLSGAGSVSLSSYQLEAEEIHDHI